MSRKIKDLVKSLKTKNQDEEVECIVVTKSGGIVCMDIECSSKDMIDLLKMFPNNKHSAD